MNLYDLFQLLPAKIEYINKEGCTQKKPIIRVYDKKAKEVVVFDKMFTDQECLLLDLRILSNMWDDLLADDGQSSSYAKQIEIAEFLGGAKRVQDILTMMAWLQKRCDINNDELLINIY